MNQKTITVKIKKGGVKNRNLLDPHEVKPKRIVRPSNYRTWQPTRPNDQSWY